MPFLSQNNTPGLRTRRVLLPDDPLWLADVLGALLPLARAYNWQQYGDLTSADMAAFYETVIAAIDWESAQMDIGTVFFTAGESQPIGCLAADGTQVLIADWPLLYAEIGDAYGAAGDGYFRLPDLARRAVVGAGTTGDGTYSTGDSGGAESVTLAETQIPSHSHSIHTHLDGLAVAPGELPVTTPSVVPGSTGATGGGNAHENRPPYLALNAWIVAR